MRAPFGLSDARVGLSINRLCSAIGFEADTLSTRFHAARHSRKAAIDVASFASVTPCFAPPSREREITLLCLDRRNAFYSAPTERAHALRDNERRQNLFEGGPLKASSL